MSPSNSHEPKVDLVLVEPKEIVVPPFVPLSEELLHNIALREAAERNLPTLSWVGEQLKKIDEEEENDSQERPLIEDFLRWQRISQQYCYKLYEWYRNTMMSVNTTYESWQLSKRMFYLYFEIHNSGKLPAERIDVEIEFPSGIKVNERGRLVYPVFPPPNISEVAAISENREIPLEVCPEIEFPEWSLHLGRRYEDELKTTNYKSIAGSEYISIKQSEDSGHYIGVCRLLNLEHGKARKINPVKILFDKDTEATPLLLKYKTHASNQPVDVRGEIEIQVHDSGKAS